MLDAQTLSQLPQVGQDWSSFNILIPGAAGLPWAIRAPWARVLPMARCWRSTAICHSAPSLPMEPRQHCLPAPTLTSTPRRVIQEVQVGTSAFSAQYGVGGILYNQISKGGTDRFHGSAYEYFQNDALNAKSYNFGGPPQKPRLRYNNFGGSIGGPILKRKLFFYFNFDKTNPAWGQSATFYAVPTTAVLGGDFTGFPTIYDPQTTTVVGGVVHRTSFADEYHNGTRFPPAGSILWPSLPKNISLLPMRPGN